MVKTILIVLTLAIAGCSSSANELESQHPGVIGGENAAKNSSLESTTTP